jgi:hypothetical protein
MYDAGLYPLDAIRLLQAHWQTTKGKPCHKARMKDAGAKAALARKRRDAARKAVETRKRNAERQLSGQLLRPGATENFDEKKQPGG